MVLSMFYSSVNFFLLSALRNRTAGTLLRWFSSHVDFEPSNFFLPQLLIKLF